MIPGIISLSKKLLRATPVDSVSTKIERIYAQMELPY
jgi:hypothetical protein